MKLILKKVKVLIISLSMAHVPSLFAIDQIDNFNDNLPAAVSNNSHLIAPTVQMIQGITNQMLQSSRSLSQARRSTSLINQLNPKAIPAKYFGHCQISQVNTAFPNNICRPPTIPGQGNIGEARAIKNLGYRYRGYFEKLLTPGQNTSTPVGLQCLEDAKTQVLSSIKDRANNLEMWMSRIKKESQAFTKSNEKDLEEIRSLNGILSGAGKGQTTEEQNRNFRDFFPSNECQTLIGQSSLEGKNGLIGIRKSLEPIKNKANIYGDNKAVYEHDLQKEIQRIKSDIESRGVSSLALSKGVTGRTQFAGVRDAIEKKVQILTREREKITREIKKLDPEFDVPDMDQNFGVDFEEFTKGAEEHFRLSYINKCATLEEFGVGINVDQILKSLEQRSTGSRGNKHKNYFYAIQNILKTNDGSNNFISNKLSEIKRLESLYGANDITVSYQNSQAVHVNETVYQLFSKIVSSCEKKYKQSNIHATNDGKRISQVKQVKRAMKSLKDLVALEKTFTAQLANEIVDQVVNCEGRKLNANSCNGAGSLFDTGKPEFCIKHASSCYSRVQACYQKAQNEVKKVQTKKSNIAKVYNKKVEAMLKKHDNYLQVIGQQVLADAQYLRNFFPGSDFNLPKDFYIKDETKEQKLHGESILGGGKTDFSGSLVEQVGKLQKMLLDQQKVINQKIGKYIGEQKMAMEKNQSKWANLTAQCETVEEDIIEKQVTANQAQQQQHQELQGQVGEFCHKYGMLKADNPVAGCGGEASFSPKDLYEDYAKVSQFVSSDVKLNIQAYSQVCAAYNNEMESESGNDNNYDDSQEKGSMIAEICEGNSDLNEVKNELVQRMMPTIPDDLRDNRQVIRFLKNGGSGKLPRVLKGTSAQRPFELYKKSLNGYTNLTYKDLEKMYGKEKRKNLESEIDRLKKSNGASTKVSKCEDISATGKQSDCKNKTEKLNKLIAKENNFKKLSSKINDYTESGNFCHQHFIAAAKDAIEKCEDCDEDEIIKKYNKYKYKSKGITKGLDRAIASADKNKYAQKWKEIGQRQELGYCDYNSQQDRAFAGLGENSSIDQMINDISSGGLGI